MIGKKLVKTKQQESIGIGTCARLFCPRTPRSSWLDPCGQSCCLVASSWGCLRTIHLCAPPLPGSLPCFGGYYMEATGPSWPIPRWVVTFSLFLHHDCHLHSKEESWSNNIKHVWLVVSTPLKNISQWEGLSHILWKIKNVWKHHPDVLSNQLTFLTFLSQSYEYLSSALEGTTERLCWERLHLWRPWWLPSSLSLVVLITLDSKINPIPKYRNALSKLNPTHFTRFYPLACTVKPSDCLANMERPGVKMQ